MGPYVSFSTNGGEKEQDDKKNVITMSLLLRIPPVSMLPAIVYAATCELRCDYRQTACRNRQVFRDCLQLHCKCIKQSEVN